MTNPATKGFNADGRAKDREKRPVTIGGREFFQARRTPPVMREIRRVSRENEEAARRVAELDPRGELEARRDDVEDQLAKLKPEDVDSRQALTARLLELEQKIDEISPPDAQAREEIAEIEDATEERMYEQVALLLRAKDGEEPPTGEFVQEHLDIEEVRDLMSFLSPAAGGAEDPTPAATGPTNSS